MLNLKEIEKFGAKKGVGKYLHDTYKYASLSLIFKLRICVVLQTIKDVNQSLVDDNLVETDRIGAGAFFWALPSKGF